MFDGANFFQKGDANRPLNDTFLKNLKPPVSPKKYKYFDGLYLYSAPTGLKSGRFNHRFDGQQQTLTFGTYPLVSLKEARDKLVEAKRSLKAGFNPTLKIKSLKEAERPVILNSFEIVAREWFENKKTILKNNYTSRIIGRLEKDLFPFLAERPINEISAPELLGTLRKIETRGAVDTAHRCLQYCGQIFRYAIATGRATHDLSADLRGALKPARHSHFSSLKEPMAVAGLLRAIDGYSGHSIVKIALQIAPYVFVRPGELRHAEWKEVNLEAAEWQIPAEKMKMKQLHIVPLAKQVLDKINELRYYTGKGRYLFPSMRSDDRPISDMTLLAGLRRLDFSKEEMTVHGFRSIASTLLNEQGYNRDWIERQLAHGERNSIRAAYNYAEYLPERRKMMQEWADYLDMIKRQGNDIK
ncbi:MAG: tyrosine-type recombinase/integrase [Deltaproteobacteria bacterium]|nr:tyrosine-type recombinase/integrase [Deltaproteobacteria bacterium]